MAIAADEQGARLGAEEAAPEAASTYAPARPHPLWRDMLRRRMLALADATAALLAALSFAVISDAGVPHAFWAALFLPAWILLAKLHGLYDRDHRALRPLTVDELPTVLVWALTGTAATAAFLSFTPAGPPELGDSARAWAIAAGAGLIGRGGARLLWRLVTPPDRTLIIGSGPLADAMHRKLALFPEVHAVVRETRRDDEVEQLAADPAYLADVDRVIVATRAIDDEVLADLLEACRRASTKLSVVTSARGALGTGVHLSQVAELPVVEFNTSPIPRSTLLLKRMLDVAVSALVLTALAPLLVAIAVAIRVDSRGRVLFVQRRAGQNGAPFRMYKFRSMSADAEARLSEVVELEKLEDPMFKLRNDPRVTRVGRFLRRTSLDELPQLVNVLKGEMSLVGPRPEQVEVVERYTPEQRFRLAAKPGMTGPMQVFGRGQLTFDERMAVEREYIENISLGRDLRILLLTLPVVSRMRGAY